MALGFIMMLHGMAHGVGFAGAWQLNRDIPYKTTLLGGRLDLGPVGIRIVGIIWLIVGLSFVLGAMAALANHPVWLSLTILALGSSAVLCLAELPEARIGAWVNAAIALALVVSLVL
jgi:hypothetical protein